MANLTATDFPVYFINNRVYGRGNSTPICVAPNDRVAAEIANRLNRDNLHQTASFDGQAAENPRGVLCVTFD